MASSFDSVWEQYASKMDDAVDEVLADRVLYALDGQNFEMQPAFVIDETAGGEGLESLDEDQAVRKRIKIRKTIVALPSLQHRIRHPKLGPGTFRPTNSIPETMGRYWLFDVQKVKP